MFCRKWKARVAELEREYDQMLDAAVGVMTDQLMALMVMAKTNQLLNQGDAARRQERSNHILQIDVLTRENQRLRRELEVKNGA